MINTEVFPAIRMKIDRLLKITNEYQFYDLVMTVYCINLCINNRSETFDEFKCFFDKIYDVIKPGIADDYTVEDFGEVRIRHNDKFYRVIIGTGHNNVFACLNFLPTLARMTSHGDELNLALGYSSGVIDYFIEENKNDGIKYWFRDIKK